GGRSARRHGRRDQQSRQAAGEERASGGPWKSPPGVSETSRCHAPHVTALAGGDHEVRATVFRPRLFVVPGVERELLAVADGTRALGRDAERDEVGFRGEGAALA